LGNNIFYSLWPPKFGWLVAVKIGCRRHSPHFPCLGVYYLPKNTEIIFGTIHITINSMTKRMFEIEAQKTSGIKDKKLLPVTIVSLK
jgi:hypothetical protein